MPSPRPPSPGFVAIAAMSAAQLVACVSGYYKPGATRKDLKRDSAHCHQVVETQVPVGGFAGHDPATGQARWAPRLDAPDPYEACLNELGWTREKPAGAPGPNDR